MVETPKKEKMVWICECASCKKEIIMYVSPTWVRCRCDKKMKMSELPESEFKKKKRAKKKAI